MRGSLTALLLAFCLSSAPTLADESMDPEIAYLLTFVADSGCEFIRNDTSHNSADAADHLRLKYRRGKRYVNNAEQFIDRLASESSWTGKPYSVSCSGESEPARAWLHRALDDYRATRGA